MALGGLAAAGRGAARAGARIIKVGAKIGAKAAKAAGRASKAAAKAAKSASKAASRAAKAAGKAGAKAGKSAGKAGSKAGKKLGKGLKSVGSKIKANPKLAATLAAAGVAGGLAINAMIEGRNLDIVAIKPIADNKILIQTQKRNMLELEEEIDITKTNSSPTIDGTHQVLEVLDDRQFYISGTITQEGTKGNLNKEYSAKELVTDGIVESAEAAALVTKEVGKVALDVGADLGGGIIGDMLAKMGLDLDNIKLYAMIIVALCLLSSSVGIALKFA